MSRPDLQEKLLETFRGMRDAANVTTQSKSEDREEYNFHNGRFTAFNDCIRELTQSIKESE